jgi:hypothetical protein
MLSRIKEQKALEVLAAGLSQLEIGIEVIANQIADLGPGDIDPTCPFGNQPSLYDQLTVLQGHERRLLQEKFAIEDGTKEGVCENCLKVILRGETHLVVHKDIYCTDCIPKVVEYEKNVESVLTVGALIDALRKYDRSLPVVIGTETRLNPNVAAADVQSDPAGWPVITLGDVLDNSPVVTEREVAD